MTLLDVLGIGAVVILLMALSCLIVWATLGAWRMLR